MHCPCEFCAERKVGRLSRYPYIRTSKTISTFFSVTVHSFQSCRFLCSLFVFVFESCGAKEQCYMLACLSPLPVSKPVGSDAAAGPGCNHSDNILVIVVIARDRRTKLWEILASELRMIESTSDQSPGSCKRLGQIELAQKAAHRVDFIVSHLVVCSSHGV